jgi:hypothetical protein
MLDAAVPAVIVSVDYRLAPEHSNPAAYDDAFASLKAVVAACRPDGLEPWLAAHGDASPVVLAGENLRRRRRRCDKTPPRLAVGLDEGGRRLDSLLTAALP